MATETLTLPMRTRNRLVAGFVGVALLPAAVGCGENESRNDLQTSPKEEQQMPQEQNDTQDMRDGR